MGDDWKARIREILMIVLAVIVAVTSAATVITELLQ